ncbi:MAG: hypothetical protein H0T46_23035 [Deltaproteobacteria bacterium]|nr:hypothetical protein [Deltaproteobacteria bacterium]
MSVPAPITFIQMYLSAKQVFGTNMPADFLIERVRSYDWKGSISRLAQLAAYIQYPGRTPEEILRRTVDPILQLTGQGDARPLIARAQVYVRANRERMLIAHDEVISYLQHLVLVEGGNGREEPTDIELAFWMLGANCHLGEWGEKDSRDLTLDEQLIAAQVRGHTFNQEHNWPALVVRSYALFQACAADENLGGQDAALRVQEETFGAPFVDYYRLILAVLLAMVWRAGDENSVPGVGIDYWKTTGADLDWVRARLNAIGVTRTEAAAAILAAKNARGEDGLLHAPALLRKKPLLIEDEGWLVISMAAIATQVHTGPWGAYLERSKANYGDKIGFQKWSSAFGNALELYCGQLARAAAESPRFRRNWRLVLPSSPGASDEIEDVIIIEDDHAILFSIKSSLLPEDQIHRARSRSAIIDWLDRFLFSDDRNFKGALRKLSKNIDEVRNGDFESQGVSRTLKILPVLITYDEIGDDVILHQRIRAKCKEHQLMMQSDVAPVAIGSVEEFEALMEYVAEGRSLVGFLKKRKQNRPWFGRRLDQQIGSLSPPIAFKLTTERFEQLFGEMEQAVRGPRSA